VCDLFWTLKRVIEPVPSGLGINQASVASALDRIGSVPSGLLQTISYGPHRRDAVSGGWAYRFEEPCGCLRYFRRRFTLA